MNEQLIATHITKRKNHILKTIFYKILSAFTYLKNKITTYVLKIQYRLPISKSDAIVNEWTMVIEVRNATIADTAVLRS